MITRPTCLRRYVQPVLKSLPLWCSARVPLYHPQSTRRYNTFAEAVGPPSTGLPSISNTVDTDAATRITKNHRNRKEPPEVQVTFTRQELLKELSWLRDPFDLAEKTKSRLQKGNEQEKVKALELVRLASGRMKCTVSWNHLINDHLLNRQVPPAIKLYNEMKKRAQLPDAFTFTILLSGLAHNVREPGSLEKALAIYNSMRAEKSPVKPNLTHTNALLNICALKHDVDAMLGVAADLPTKGRDAPDRLTYTIVLNAIRHAAEAKTNPRDPTSIQGREREEVRNQAVLQGRRLWEEIRDRWSNLDFKMDEELVCAMGRILILGQTKQDYDDVFSLLSQTMQLPRQVPKLGDESRQAIEEEEERENDIEEKARDFRSNTREVVADKQKTFSSITPQEQVRFRREDSNPFDPVSLSSHQYVVPGNMTLSLALDVCADLRIYRSAQDYWGLLTDPAKYNIEPDLQNYISYLRMLRFRRQSRMTLEIVKDMKAALLPKTTSTHYSPVPPKVFRIALSTCARDKKNRNSLGYAKELLTIMGELLETPDPQALESYLTVALAHDRNDYTVALNAAESCIAPFRTLRSHITKGYQEVSRLRASKKTIERLEDEVMNLASTMIRTYDVALSHGNEVMTPKERALCKSSRAWLMAWITRRHEIRKADAERYAEIKEMRQKEEMERLRVEKEEKERAEREWAEKNPEEAFRRKWLERNDDRKFRRNMSS